MRLVFTLILFFIVSPIISAACLKSSWSGQYYFEIKDAQQDEFILYYSTKTECEEASTIVKNAKPPYEFCSCHQALRKRNWVYAPYMFGATYKYLLYCYSMNAQGIMTSQHIETWADESNSIIEGSSSLANEQACEKAKTARANKKINY